MPREDEIMEIQMDMRRKFSKMCAEALKKGEIKKPEMKDFIAGYRLDDDGNRIN